MKHGCIFGDSLAKGAVLTAEGDKYEYLEQSFVDIVSGKLSLSVDNYAKFGCTAPRALRALQRRSGELSDMDFVVLELGGNDSDFDWSTISQQPAQNHLPRTELSEFTQAYRTMVAQIRAAGAQPVILNMPPLDHKRYFERISRGLNAQNILQWLGGSSEFIYRFHESYNNTLCALASELKVPLIDVRSGFTLRRDYHVLLCEDGIHLNRAGQRLYASELERGAKRLLAACAG